MNRLRNSCTSKNRTCLDQLNKSSYNYGSFSYQLPQRVNDAEMTTAVEHHVTFLSLNDKTRTRSSHKYQYIIETLCEQQLLTLLSLHTCSAVNRSGSKRLHT